MQNVTTLIRSVLFSLAFTAYAPAQLELVGHLAIPGDATDLFPGAGVNQNRLGGFGSSLHYDPVQNEYLGLVDRGPGGGVIPYQTRLQVFGLDINPTTGAPGNFVVKETIPFMNADGSAGFNGLAPGRLNGSPFVLGMSFDPEGLVVGPTGHYFVADEYGPSIYEFAPVDIAGQTQARFVRAFTLPGITLPRDANGNVNYDAVRAPSPPDPALTLVSGRQDNRGFEGLAISPDGSKLLAILQGPLAEEGSSNQGRNSRNTRWIEFDIATGLSGRQFIYQLTDRAQVNAVIAQTNPDPAAAIAATAQGRTLVLSDILPLNDHQFLVLERDNRGVGSDNPAGADPILSAIGLKEVYLIDTTGATDVSGISLRGTNSLTTPVLPGNPDPPITITPVSKQPYFDIRQALVDAGLTIPEKIEGITFGPTLSDGRPLLILSSDNDVSVSQTVMVEGGQRVDRQFEIYTLGNQTRYTPLDDQSKSYVNIANPAGPDYLVDQGSLPAGFEPLPSYLYTVAVPEPSSASLLLIMGATLGLRPLKRRH